MRNRTLLLFFTLLFPAALQANDVYFPQIVYGGGYTTKITVLNTGTTAVNGSIRFYDQNGVSRQALNTTISLPPGGSSRIPLANSGPLTVLSAEIIAGAGTIDAVATYESYTAEGTILTNASVNAVTAANRFRVPVDASTGIAISNVGDSGTVALNLRLLGEDGSLFAAATDVRLQSLNARRQYAGFVSSFFPQIEGTAFKGTLLIEKGGSSPIAATAVSVKESTLSALPVIAGAPAAGGDRLFFPQVVSGGGYSTSFVLMNTGATDVTSRVDFFNEAGLLQPEFTTPVRIPAGGSTRFAFPNSGSLKVLWGEMSGAAAIKGSATFEQRGSDGSLIAAGGIAAVEPVSSVRIPAEISSVTSTAIALANTGNADIAVNLLMFDQTGLAMGIRSVTLSAHQHLATYLRSYFPLSLKGTLIVDAGSSNTLIASGFSIRERGSAIDGPPAAVRALPRELTASEGRVSQASNEFSFALWNQVNSRERGKSLFISPLSASFALGMVLNGAAGRTFDDMRSALRLGGASQQEINEGYQSMISLLTSLDPGVAMEVANSVWYRNGFPFYDSFRAAATQYFDAEVRGLNFADKAGTLGTINGWVDAKTHHKIPTILNDISPNDVMVLINAIYFNGNWREKFEANQTTNATFTPENGTPQTKPLMHRRGKMRYADTPEFQAVDLTYGNSAFTMSVLLPKSGNTVDGVAASLSAAQWDVLTPRFESERDVDLYLPKFRLEYGGSLVGDLKALGMTSAFVGSDFSRLSSESTAISDVIQKAFVDVNEAGTEAAAVTAVIVATTSIPVTPQPILMRVDHPFIFVIRERFSGTILFMGKIVQIP